VAPDREEGRREVSIGLTIAEAPRLLARSHGKPLLGNKAHSSMLFSKPVSKGNNKTAQMVKEQFQNSEHKTSDYEDSEDYVFRFREEVGESSFH
jgi:hypothetical protein